eukprot:CAMPEP_0118933364 /NCGR_PEP_ID=MMETSP1169-20130426/11948_1 /TAXON_ID=36882 /ORGANISM="Pyramimonas obovata, Strain CCMP722" /LENGTH=271 /DNA_ID=CAMNT_0006876117 /DNA_START=144 /DNA_END=955 /DNA_ORIENTATION=+
MGSVARAPLPACVASVGRSRGGESSAFRGVGKHQHGRIGRSFYSSESLVSSSSTRVLKSRGAQHKLRTRFECRAAGEEAASAERTAPPPPLSSLGMELNEALRSQPERVDELIEEQLERLALQRQTDLLEAALHESGEDILLRRIAEVREAERSSVVMDMLYSSVLSQMDDFNVTPLSACEEPDLNWLHSRSSRADLQALLDMQPSQAIDLVKKQIATMTAGFSELSRSHPTRLPKLGVAQVYRRALLFGYSLQQGTERYTLELAAAPAPR